MKQIPIKNVKLLARLDNFATQLLKMPHTFRALPQPDLTFKKLKEHMADNTFNGWPTSYNYQDYSGQSHTFHRGRQSGLGENRRPGGQQKKRLRAEKHFFLALFKKGMGQSGVYQQNDKWYYDTVTVMPPRWGHTGWHNAKNKPRRFLRFIYNSGSGYSIMVEGKKQTTIKDQRRDKGAGNWTCIEGFHPADGSSWFADTNTGSRPRVVIDVSIPERYEQSVDSAINFITTY